MSRWIGLTGRAGAGKDHTFSQLEKISPRFVKVSFAAGLRSEIEEVLQADLPVLWDKPTLPDVRKLLQWWGTDLRRATDPDYWVKVAERTALSYKEYTPVFTDVRFPNEADMIRRHGGLLVRVMAPQNVREERLGKLPPEHASETAMDDYPTDMTLLGLPGNDYDRWVRKIFALSIREDLNEPLHTFL